MIYLDNSSTTHQFDEVTEEFVRLCHEVFGNPSSLHNVGFDAEKVIKSAKKTVLDAIDGAKDDNIIFTSGGTESNNLAILGLLQSRLKRCPHIITTKIEHPSVLEPCRYLEAQGARVSYVGVGSDGAINISEIKSAITEKTDLISVMLVNNEVGSISPIEEISRYVKKINPKIIVHADAVQAFCKMDIDVQKTGIDLLSISGHKIHGPKGVGCLYIKKGINVKPVIFGGGQQGGLRSGTENVPAVGAFAKAIEINTQNMTDKLSAIRILKEQLISALSEIDGCTINSPQGENTSPNIINASFSGVRSETMLHALESKGVYVSTGSACSSNHPGLSHVLAAMGYDKKTIDSAVRFSLGAETTAEQIAQAAEFVKEAYKVLSI